MSFDVASLVVAISSVVVSVASLCVSVRIGRHSVTVSERALEQAERVAERAGADWRQQQWFTLFLASNAAYDSLDRFQFLAADSEDENTNALFAAHVTAVDQLRKAQSLARVFPKCQEVEALFAAVVPQTYDEYADPTQLQMLLEAVEGIRRRALVTPDVLSTR